MPHLVSTNDDDEDDYGDNDDKDDKDNNYYDGYTFITSNDPSVDNIDGVTPKPCSDLLSKVL